MYKGISEEVWDYQIGGYPVIEKWFKEHKGNMMTIDIFNHIEKMVGVIEETLLLESYLAKLH